MIRLPQTKIEWAFYSMIGGALGLHCTAVAVFKAEDFLSDHYRSTKAAIIDDIARNNGYAPMIGSYVVNEAKASRGDIERYIADASFRHYQKSGKTLNEFKRLLSSVVLNESVHNSDALSKAGALGLGQVMSFNVGMCGLNNAKDLINPESNIDCSAQILASNLKTAKGDEAGALSLYNWGYLPGSKDKKGIARAMPAETKKYIGAVLEDYRA